LIGAFQEVGGLGNTDGDFVRYLFGGGGDPPPESITDLVKFGSDDFEVSPPELESVVGSKRLGELSAGDCSVRAKLVRGEAMHQNMLSTIDSSVEWVAILSWPMADVSA
jgi:hypothetical protein